MRKAVSVLKEHDMDAQYWVAQIVYELVNHENGAEEFVNASGIQVLAQLLPKAKYPVILYMADTLVALATPGKNSRWKVDVKF